MWKQALRLAIASGPLRRYFDPRRTIFDVGSDHRDSIFLAGSARSGTTWLSEIINHRNEYRYLFEPFHSNRVPLCQNFQYRQYLPGSNCDPQFLKPARSILSGRLRDPWVDHKNRRLISRKRLIKDVRANLLTKWLHTHFSEMPIVFMIRHPCAVAHSRMRQSWGTHLGETLEQEALIGDFLAPFEESIREIEQTGTVFEKHVALWCIENYVPLKQFQPSEMHLVFYEHLCLDPEAEVRAIVSFLQKDFDSRVLNVIDRPSSTSWADSAVKTGGDLVRSWKHGIREEQAHRALAILQLFSLDQIYSEAALPKIPARRVLASL